MRSEYRQAQLAFALIIVIVLAAMAVLIATADAGPRRDGGRTPGRCHTGDRGDRHNGLWGAGCGHFTTPGQHGGSGVRG